MGKPSDHEIAAARVEAETKRAIAIDRDREADRKGRLQYLFFDTPAESRANSAKAAARKAEERYQRLKRERGED